MKVQGHRGQNIAYFGRISPFPDDNSSAFQDISMKSHRKLCLAIVWNPIVFEGHRSKFKVTGVKT